MAPPKSRIQADDSRAEHSSATRERNGATHAGNVSRARRTAQNQAAANGGASRASAVNGHGAGGNAGVANGDGVASVSEGSKVSDFNNRIWAIHFRTLNAKEADTDIVDDGRS